MALGPYPTLVPNCGTITLLIWLMCQILMTKPSDQLSIWLMKSLCLKMMFISFNWSKCITPFYVPHPCTYSLHCIYFCTQSFTRPWLMLYVFLKTLNKAYCIVLYCIVLYCIVLYCIVVTGLEDHHEWKSLPYHLTSLKRSSFMPADTFFYISWMRLFISWFNFYWIMWLATSQQWTEYPLKYMYSILLADCMTIHIISQDMKWYTEDIWLQPYMPRYPI